MTETESDRIGQVIAALVARKEWVDAGRPVAGTPQWNLAYVRHTAMNQPLLAAYSDLVEIGLRD